MNHHHQHGEETQPHPPIPEGQMWDPQTGQYCFINPSSQMQGEHPTHPGFMMLPQAQHFQQGQIYQVPMGAQYIQAPAMHPGGFDNQGQQFFNTGPSIQMPLSPWQYFQQGPAQQQLMNQGQMGMSFIQGGYMSQGSPGFLEPSQMQQFPQDYEVGRQFFPNNAGSPQSLQRGPVSTLQPSMMQNITNQLGAAGNASNRTGTNMTQYAQSAMTFVQSEQTQAAAGNMMNSVKNGFSNMGHQAGSAYQNAHFSQNLGNGMNAIHNGASNAYQTVANSSTLNTIKAGLNSAAQQAGSAYQNANISQTLGNGLNTVENGASDAYQSIASSNALNTIKSGFSNATQQAGSAFQNANVPQMFGNGMDTVAQGVNNMYQTVVSHKPHINPSDIQNGFATIGGAVNAGVSHIPVQSIMNGGGQALAAIEGAASKVDLHAVENEAKSLLGFAASLFKH